MQFIRMQCPACGAPLTVASGAHATACDYCHTRFAVIGSTGQPTLRPATLPVAPRPLPPSPVQHAGISNRRGCLMAAILWFFGGPLLVLAIFAPVALLLPSDRRGSCADA